MSKTPSFAPPLRDLADSGIGVAAAPSGGMGLALDSTGKIADSVTSLFLPWLVDVDPQGGTPILVVGTWISVLNANAIFNGYLNNSSAAANDECNFEIVLAAGTWTFEMMYVKIADSGIYTVQLDDISQGTIDGYAAATTYNNLSSISGITVAATGKKRLKLKMATKNAASAAYNARVQHIQLRRTA